MAREVSRPAIVIQADRFELLRCRCPVCMVLDARYPGEGFQLALFPYRSMPAEQRPRRS
jgi:mRNA-degrading endonuclease toxin of MazEF toxin-antitoxin module